MKKSVWPVLVVVGALGGGTVTTQATTIYDGTYVGTFLGEEVCPCDPNPCINPVDPAPIAFVVTNGVVSPPGTVDSNGHIDFTAGYDHFIGSITQSGYASGTWTAMLNGCDFDGTWSATRQTGSPTPTPTPTPPPIGDAGAPAAQYYDTAEEPASGGPVDVATLAETFSHALLSVSGARPLEFTISYNSQLAAGNHYVTGHGWTLYTPGDVGHWTHNFEGQATLVTGNPNQVVLLVAHRRWTFLQSGSSYQIVGHASPYDSLVRHSDGSYTLTTKDQSTYTFSGSGLYLTRVTNPHGQTIVIARNSAGHITTVSEPVSGKSLSFTYGTAGSSAGRIITITSAGRTVSLAYNSNAMLTQITEANGGTTSFTYDSARHLLTETDAHGNLLTSNTYNAAHGYVMTQVDARGHQYSYTFSTGTNTTSVTVTDRNTHHSTYVFDQNQNLISFTSPLNETTRYTYDSNRNLLRKTDPLGKITTYTYDTHGNVTHITDALGKTTVMTYDSRHNLLTVTNPDNDTSTFTYDTRNNLLTATDALGHQVVRTYNTNSLLLTQSNPNSGVSTNTYTSGLLTSRTDAAGNTETMAYDAVGNLIRRTDPTGAATAYHYGTLRELLEIDDAAGHRVINTYDWRLRKSTVTDPSGAVTHYAYDGNNNIVSTTNALNQTTTFAYDNEDRPIHVTDPLGHTSARSYDADGRLIGATNAVGDTTSYTYDGANNLLTVRDGLSHTVVTNTYDARDHLVTARDALGRTSTLTYDNASLLASTQDPLGRITSFVRDALGRTTTVHAPLSTVTSQSFDADGNRTAILNANNRSTGFTFDVADRLTRITTATGKVTTYAYNNRSLTSSITLPSGTHTNLTYDALGRVSTAVDPVGTITYSYDNNGRVIRTTQTISGTTKTISRQYDLLGRLIQFTDAAGKVLRYSYDSAGNLTTLTYPDQKQVTYHYDAARRLTSVTDWASRVTSYTYDANSRVTTITRPDQSVETFTYDAAGQITRSNDVAPGSNLLHNILYTFDADGKIIREDITPAPGSCHPAALTLTVDSDNRLATINQQAAVYDNNGNLTHAIIPGSAISTLVYDARNRLVHNAGGLTYTYDAENRRMSVASAAGTTAYVTNPYAGLDQILVKTVPNGTATRYVYGLGLIGEETGSTFTTYHYDYRGSTTALTHINGSVIQRFSYGPNGEPIGFNPATAPTQFLYGGRYGTVTDANGLCYMRARYYLPLISRFINQDIVLGNASPGISLNRFAYANGNPINENDPFGLAAQPLLGNQLAGRSFLDTPSEYSVAISDNTPTNLKSGEMASANLDSLTTIPTKPKSTSQGFVSNRSDIPPWTVDYVLGGRVNILGFDTGPIDGTGAGCGSSGFQFVPDRVPGVDMTEACDAHDIAFGTYGSSKEESNRGLMNDIIEDNPQSPILGPVVGWIFYKGVSGSTGEAAFQAAQVQALRDRAALWGGQMPPIDLPATPYDSTQLVKP